MSMGLGKLGLGFGRLGLGGGKGHYPPQSFASGTVEISQFTMPTAGAYEVTDINVPSQGSPDAAESFEIHCGFPGDSGIYTSFGSPYIQCYNNSQAFYVWFTNSNIGEGADPMGTGTSIQVETYSGSSHYLMSELLETYIPNAINAAMVGSTATGAAGEDPSCTVVSDANGSANDASANGDFSINITQQGSDAVTNIAPGDYFHIYTPSTHYVGWFNVSGSGSAPGLGGGIVEFQINISLYDDDSTVASAIASAINAISGNPFDSFQFAGGNTRYAPNVLGNTTNGANGTTTLSFSIILNGSTTALEPSDYITFNKPDGTAHYAWFRYPRLNSGYIGTDPAPGGTGATISLSAIAETGSSVAADCIGPINALLRLSTSRVGATLTITNLDAGNCTDATSGTLSGASATVTQQGVSVIDLAADTVTITAHGFPTGLSVRLTTSGTLPSPLALATTYYIIRVDANTIAFATSLANALAATKINLTTTGVSTHTITQF